MTSNNHGWQEHADITGLLIKKLEWCVDDRGRLVEVFTNEDLDHYHFGQAYITVCNVGVVKAWHRHKKQDDIFFVVTGTAKIGLYDPEVQVAETVYAGENCPCVIQIPRGVWHGFTPVGDKPITVLNIPNQVYDHAHPDEDRLPWNATSIPFNWEVKNG